MKVLGPQMPAGWPRPILYAFSIVLQLSMSCRSEHLRPPTQPECNYYWERKQVHVCLVGMPADECSFLFQARPDFKRDTVCVCRERGKKTVETTSGGFRQLSCPH